MANNDSKAPMLDLFVFETNQMLEQLERLILDSEKSGGLEVVINEVFRIMHTLKGSAAMMMFNDISSLAHSLEDVFYYIRETKPQSVDYSELTDLVLNAVDFIKGEVAKVENGADPTGDSYVVCEKSREFLSSLKESHPKLTDTTNFNIDESNIHFGADASEDEGKIRYEARIFFDEDCGMENIRAFTLIHELSDLAENIVHSPMDILENDATSEVIKNEGFQITFLTQKSLEIVQEFFCNTMFLKEFNLNVVADASVKKAQQKKVIDLDDPIPDEPVNAAVKEVEQQTEGTQSFISVNVSKMDILMDLVGELVIAEAMVTQNPELQGLRLDKFYKSARQLRKITSELQDTVMSIRMVPLSATFHKMNRIVRDMVRKLDKEAQLEIIGEQTEVDKNIIESISDPLMHLIRNAVDHGIEPAQERIAQGKPKVGKIRLEAKSAGGDVLITIQDDGGGLNKEKILKKAWERGLIEKEETSLSDNQVYSFILQPGFSTNDTVTEFSGRGVGMDVVAKNIEKIGGTISVDSVVGEGTTMFIRIPLTLAIIDGMNIKVGNSIYTIPIIAIKESFRLKEQNLIKDTNNNEMIMIRGECHPVLRLYERFQVKTEVKDLREGIMVMVEADGKGICLFADSLIGQQQVVVKALPSYIKKTKGIAGCTLLGDGGVSLILDVAALNS
ncbi:chemotaxis protein CheA [Pelosinus sp. UFO1]|uniref:chemotaxis protein CheA n=1 Tax=Pelosinus sp. UFO1 TaxID=484770 RepID=UPI0004D11383|nr:chemotaxis protein CheA [Pelosinus sp. UFO1]AIF50395.1 CheA signal transduction histidine kinase [Pelosinus sp. UFO1]